MNTKKKIKNCEYYTLISATLLLRVGFFTLTDNITNEDFLYFFYDLGLADFLLIALLTTIIIANHFSGKTRLIKVFSALASGLFAVLITRLFVIFLFMNENSSTAYFTIVRMLQPGIIYIIPIGAILTLVFQIPYKKIGNYTKNSLLKLSSFVAILSCFVLTGAYIIAASWWVQAVSNFDVQRSKPEDALLLEHYANLIRIFEYAVNSLFIVVTVLCFYRGAKNLIKLQED